MSTVQGLGAGSRVLVVDDDDLALEAIMDDLRDCDYEPVSVSGGPYGLDIDRMIADVHQQNPSFVICDHKLQPHGLASFFGLDVVRRLVDAKMPAMLLTMYQQTGSVRPALRSERHLLPVILGRDDFEADCVSRYAEICAREIMHDPVDERRPHRTLIRVDWADPNGANDSIDAVITAWSPDHAVSIPAKCIDSSVRNHVRTGDYLIGDVNIGADREDDLFFTNVNERIERKDIKDLL